LPASAVTCSSSCRDRLIAAASARQPAPIKS
jgi:lolCE: lipoprotein releasing system, transmembrane protein, LolC/E family